MKKILLLAVVFSVAVASSVASLGFAYDVQPGDNALLSKVYDRIDQVYQNDHTKLITFMDAILTQEIRFSKSDQSKYFFSKIKEYIHGKLYAFVESPAFVCLQDRVQYGDSTTIQYTLQYQGGFVELPSGKVIDTPSQTPLLFNAGKGQLVAGIDQAVLGNIQGKQYGVVIEPRKGRGNIQQSLVVEYPTAVLMQQFDSLQANDHILLTVMMDDQTTTLQGTITAVDAETTAVDFNHPLAGETLLGVYTIESFFKKCQQ